jgi:Response regulator containing a CheY-like receiver domain and an HTH DNA-binding domain
MISILIADDHAHVRKALQQLLEIEGDIQVIAVASDGLEAVEQAILHSPDVAVMDVSMPFLNGIEATRQICARRPGTRVLILSMHETANYVERGIEAGASGYVLKDIACDDLVMAVRSLHQGNRFFSRQFSAVARQYSE